LTDETSVDVVILAALVKERDAILPYIQEAQATKHANAHRGRIGPYNVVLVSMNGVGPVNTAVITQQAINTWNPAYLFLCGVACGIGEPNTRILGDVLVSERIVVYEWERNLERRHRVFLPPEKLLSAVEGVDPAQWALKIHQPRPDGTTGRVIPKVHLVVLGSSEKLVEHDGLTREMRFDWARPPAGFDVEAVGAAIATHFAIARPGFLVVKGISDWADAVKQDSWLTYAAEASAAFTCALLRAEPFEPRDRPHPPPQTVCQPSYEEFQRILDVAMGRAPL